MDHCDEAEARFMSESLLGHAREICRYAKTYCAPSLANMMVEEKHREKFARTVERMITEMRSLMLMAGVKGVARFCNREQIEAYIDEARLAVSTPARVRQSAPFCN